MYEIMYHMRSEPIDVIDMNTTDTQAIVDGLQMNEDYIFQIKAYTSKGAGPWSNRLAFRTFGQRKCTFRTISILSMPQCGVIDGVMFV